MTELNKNIQPELAEEVTDSADVSKKKGVIDSTKDAVNSALVASKNLWQPMRNGSVLIGFTMPDVPYNLEIKDRIMDAAGNMKYVVKQTVKVLGEQKYALIDEKGNIDEEWGFFSSYSKLPAKRSAEEMKRDKFFVGKIGIQKDKNEPAQYIAFDGAKPSWSVEDHTSNPNNDQEEVSEEFADVKNDDAEEGDWETERRNQLINEYKNQFLKIKNDIRNCYTIIDNLSVEKRDKMNPEDNRVFAALKNSILSLISEEGDFYNNFIKQDINKYETYLAYKGDLEDMLADDQRIKGDSKEIENYFLGIKTHIEVIFEEGTGTELTN